jgi:hypothetical protein
MKTKILSIVAGLLLFAGINSQACSVRCRPGPVLLGPSWNYRAPIMRHPAPYAYRGYAGRGFFRGYRPTPIGRFNHR